MNYYINPPETQVYVDADDQSAVEAYDKLNFLRQDDPSITLDTIPESERARLTLHFVGCEHTRRQAERIAQVVLPLKPDIIMEENTGGTQQDGYSMDTAEGLAMRGIKVYGKHPKTGEIEPIRNYMNVEFSTHVWRIVHNRLIDNGQTPVVRYIDYNQVDLEAEKSRRPEIIGTGASQYIAEHIALYYTRYPLEDIAEAVRDDETANAQKQIFRDQTMIRDISRIAANILLKTDSAVTGVVTHGTVHSALYQHFSNLGINVGRSFVVDPWEITRGKMQWSLPHILGRKAVYHGQATTEEAEILVLSALTENKVCAKIRKINQKSTHEQISRTMVELDRLLQEGDRSQGLIRAWHSATPEGSEEEPKMSGLEALEEGLDKLALEVIFSSRK